KDQYGVWGYELINNGKACRITSYDRSNNEIEIPGSINGLPVTEIGNNALYYAFLTNSITIPDSITVIGDYALTGCNISTLEIPNSVTTIGDHAFDSCWNLVNITIPNSVTTIGKNAFYYCYNLPSITIPNGVTSIGAYAFNDCFALTSITIPTSVTDIGDFAFSDCENLRDVYYRGNESEWADIAISPSNDYLINATIHYNCAPPAVSTYTDKYGVWNCKLRDDGTGYIITGYKGNKTEIEIPSFIADLPVLEIESSTFYDHNALTSVTIPASVIFIEDQTFNSSKLTEIKVSPNNNYFSSIDGVLFNKAQTTLIRYPCNAPTTYTIPDTVTTIAIAAFIQCELLTNVIIPDSVTYIRGGAFGGCFSLNNVIIPDSVTYLGAWGFDSCLSLTNITLSKKLTAINYRTFYVCPFTSIAIPDSVTYIGDYAFDHCRKLTDVTIPGSVTTIDEFAFEFCNNLTNVTISNGVTSINNCAFIYCSNLTSVTIPSSVTTIGDAAFSSCTKLTDIYYTGSESDWNNTTIGINNKDLTNANIHYNYVPQITGDVSGDGEVAVDDVIYTLKYIVGDVELTEAQLANADVSKDGNVTVLDSVLIQRMILEMN
ncbi:MAG: leucine-rich repeat protein, partial [Acutalibacteraceae bacterium]|nr:leucine-rich repeat protein [Acutalibacteraceae bacterium]